MSVQYAFEITFEITDSQYDKLVNRVELIQDIEVPDHSFSMAEVFCIGEFIGIAYMQGLVFKTNDLWYVILNVAKLKDLPFLLDWDILKLMLPVIGMGEGLKEDMIRQCVLDVL